MPSPLANYAYDNGGGWTGADALDFGVRILADTDVASLPEPVSIALLGLGLAGLASRRRKTRRDPV